MRYSLHCIFPRLIENQLISIPFVAAKFHVKYCAKLIHGFINNVAQYITLNVGRYYKNIGLVYFNFIIIADVKSNVLRDTNPYFKPT